MSPGERKASHLVERVKYRVVGTWSDDSKISEPNPPKSVENKPKGIDAGLLAFSNLTNDINEADDSFRHTTRELQADEVKCGEPWFGEAFVCKANDTSVVIETIATRPSQEIYHYWLEKISGDFIEYKRVSAFNCKDDCGKADEVVKAFEKAYNEDGSIFLKLRAAYCKEEPSGTYPDINGQLKHCMN
jgi:hypothetical protein